MAYSLTFESQHSYDAAEMGYFFRKSKFHPLPLGPMV